MRWVAVIVVLGTLVACGRCGGQGDPIGLPSVGGDAMAVGSDVPMPGAVYKEAYDRARDEVNADNARERLDELEHAIDREAEAMR